MSETVEVPCRRWPYVLGAAVLLVFVLPLAWRYRPLNSTERKIVGSWVSESGIALRFGGDRVVSIGGGSDVPATPYATWRTSGDAVYLTSLEVDPSLAAKPWYLQILPTILGKRRLTEGALIEFDDPSSAKPSTFRMPALILTRVGP